MPEPMDFAEAHRTWRCTACGARPHPHRLRLARHHRSALQATHFDLLAEGHDRPHTWTGGHHRAPLERRSP